jgi:hypothetical protein
LLDELPGTVIDSTSSLKPIFLIENSTLGEDSVS